MIIAVLSNVYQDIIQKIDADYNANLVMAYSKMRFDYKYGLLIFSQPPFNVIAFFLMPVLWLFHYWVSDEQMSRFNIIFCKITFIPLAFVLFIIFLSSALVLLPFAYIKGLVLYPKQQKEFKMVVLYFVVWLFGGIFLLLFYTLNDCSLYFKLVFAKP